VKTISFASLKGGVGKSTSSISAAKIFSQEGKTLLIDIDPRTATTSHVFDDIEKITGRTIHQAMKSEISISECVFPANKNLYFIPSEMELKLIEVELAAHPNKSLILFELLQEVEDDFDFCIIDAPNDLGILSNNAVIASDLIVFPTQAEKWSARAISMTLAGFEPCRKVGRYTGKQFEARILVTDFEENRDIQAVMLNAIKEEFQGMVCDTVIHHSIDVTRTYAQTGEFLPKGSRPEREYRAFVSEIRGIL
jgi:cellulose biosynthesis protein BcsQ